MSSDGSVIIDVRADNSNIEGDMKESESLIKKGGAGIANAAGTAAVAVGAAAAAATAGAIKFGVEFEQSLANASTLFGEVEVDTKALSDGILELSDSSGVAASEISDGLYSALSAGVPVTEDMGEALDFLEKSTQLAVAGFTDTDTAISATAKTLNAYGLDISEAERIQRILMQTQNNGITTVGELGGALAGVTPTAAAMGVEFEQVGAGLATLTASGVTTSGAVTQMNALFAELGQQGTKGSEALAAATANSELAGMSFTEMMEAGVPLNEVLDLMSVYAEENNASLLDMFGSLNAGQAALGLAGENSATFNDNLEAMSTEVDVVGEAFDNVTDTTGARFDKMMNQLRNTLIKMFESIQPLLEQLLPVFIELIDMLIPPLMEIVEGILPFLIELFEELAPPLIEIIEQLLPPLIELFEALMPVIMLLVEIALPLIVAFLNDIFIPLIYFIVDTVLPPLIDIIEFLAETLGIAVDFMLSSLTNFLDPLLEVVGSIIGIFTSLIDFIKAVFTGDWEAAWDAVANIFKNIWNSIVGFAYLPMQAIVSMVNGVLRQLNKISVPDWVPGFGGAGVNLPLLDMPEPPKLADGGIAYDETLATVAEYGNSRVNPEVIAPLDQLMGMIEGAIGSSQSDQVISINLNVDSDVNVDGFNLAKIVIRYFDEALRFR